MCAGAWSGILLDGVVSSGNSSSSNRYENMITPLRGHLLQIPASDDVPRLRHGAMECKYVKVGMLTQVPDQMTRQCTSEDEDLGWKDDGAPTVHNFMSSVPRRDMRCDNKLTINLA